MDNAIFDLVGTTSPAALRGLQADSPVPTPKPGDDVHEAAETFEAFVLGQFVEIMFQGVDDDPLFGGGQGAAVYRSLLHREYANHMAASGGIGIADQVAAELLRAQETSQ